MTPERTLELLRETSALLATASERRRPVSPEGPAAVREPSRPAPGAPTLAPADREAPVVAGALPIADEVPATGSPELDRPREHVDALSVLADLVVFLRRFVFLSDAQADAVALWIVHSHAIELRRRRRTWPSRRLRSDPASRAPSTYSSCSSPALESDHAD